jgi:hypothetical protein
LIYSYARFAGLADIANPSATPSGDKKMNYKKELIEQFRAIYRIKFNKNIDDEDAAYALKELAELIRLAIPDDEDSRYE